LQGWLVLVARDRDPLGFETKLGPGELEWMAYSTKRSSGGTRASLLHRGLQIQMRLLTWYGLTAIASVSLITGCSGYLSSADVYRPLVGPDGARSVLPAGFQPLTARPSWMKSPPAGDPSGGAGHIAVAQFGGSSVLWFVQNNKQNKPPTTCEPASSTNGIAIDRYGNLWVPNGRANTTTEYAPNCGSAKLTIPDPTGEPADVGFDGKNHVYILNLNNHSGPPTVEIYNATSGKQIGTLKDPSFNILFGIGTDRLGNIFVSNLTTGNVGNVIEFPKGKMPGVQLSGVALGLPGAPTFDASNNLIISDWYRLKIDVFAPPYDGPPTTAPLQGSSIWCKLNHVEKHLYCGDADFGSIDVYSYPGNAYQYSYTAGLSPSALVTGVAPDPAASYGK
jgi:hypothetical protein